MYIAVYLDHIRTYTTSNFIYIHILLCTITDAAGISAAGPGGARRRGRRRRPVGRSPETEQPPVRARRRSRHMSESGPQQCRSEPCDSAAGQGGGQRWGRRRRPVSRSPEMEPPRPPPQREQRFLILGTWGKDIYLTT